MKIVVDAMGGDFAPKVNVDGAIDALREYPDMEIILVGPETLIEETISAYSNAEAMAKVRNRLTVVDAPEVITTEEHPVMALRRKKNSTFVVGMDIVRRKEAQAFVSAGSTGALMAGCNGLALNSVIPAALKALTAPRWRRCCPCRAVRCCWWTRAQTRTASPSGSCSSR